MSLFLLRLKQAAEEIFQAFHVVFQIEAPPPPTTQREGEALQPRRTILFRTWVCPTTHFHQGIAHQFVDAVGSLSPTVVALEEHFPFWVGTAFSPAGFYRFLTPALWACVTLNVEICHTFLPFYVLPGVSARVISVADIAATLCSLLNQNLAHAARGFGDSYSGRSSRIPFLQEPSRMRSAELNLLVIQVRLCLGHRFVGGGGFADVRPPSVSDVHVATGLIPFDFIAFAFARFHTPNNCCCHKLLPFDAFPGASARVVSVADIAASLCSLLNPKLGQCCAATWRFSHPPTASPKKWNNSRISAATSSSLLA